MGPIGDFLDGELLYITGCISLYIYRDNNEKNIFLLYIIYSLVVCCI